MMFVFVLQVRDRIMAGEMLLTPEEIDELKQTFIGMYTLVSYSNNFHFHMEAQVVLVNE